MKRTILLSLCISTIGISHADGGPGDSLRYFDLPFDNVLLKYSSWLEDFVGVYFTANFKVGERVRCIMQNTYAGEVSAAWNSGSISFTGDKIITFTKELPQNTDEYYVKPDTPQIFLKDKAPNKWQSYASCRLLKHNYDV